MTKFTSLLLAMLSLVHVHAEEIEIALDRMPLAQVLSLYQEVTSDPLVIAAQVRAMKREITTPPTTVQSEEAQAKLIREALLKQAGVVVSKLEDGRVSVTYNDALIAGKTAPAAPQQPEAAQQTPRIPPFPRPVPQTPPNKK